jgi:hypothetical protein
MRVAIYARVSTSNNGQDPAMQTVTPPSVHFVNMKRTRAIPNANAKP